MRQIRPEYEFPIEGRAWTSGELPTAGVFFLDGDCHIVAHQGPAAMELQERGALLIALVRFDLSPLEGRPSQASVRPLGIQEAVARFAHPAGGDVRPASRHRIHDSRDHRDLDADS